MTMTIEERAAFRKEEEAQHVGQLAALRLYHAAPGFHSPDELIELAEIVSAHAELARWNSDGQDGRLSQSARDVLRLIHEEEAGYLEKERNDAEPGNPLHAEDIAHTERRLGIVTAALEKAAA